MKIADQGISQPIGSKQTGAQSGFKQKLLAFASLIILVIVFSVASSNFFQFSNLVGILVSTAVIGVLALGATFVIITGGIDLALGTVMTFSSVMVGVFITFWGLPVPLGIVGGILAGALCGFISGLMVAKMNIPPFIATLAIMMITKGLSLVITGAKPIYFNDDPIFAKIAMGKMIPGIPNTIIIFLLLGIIASIILSKTIIGRYNFALGSNEEATRLSGVNTVKWKIVIYTITGIFSGIAGILMASRLNSAQPSLGTGYELEAIAAVVIGGTSLSGGVGSILGTIIGALIMSVLTNGLQIMSVAQEWRTVIVGVVIIIAVYADILRRRKQ
ncbi:ribose ABC transporter permease [Paenibacillus sp. VTT E-133280]|uniref:ABC transporter permease n=1 Tax=Paenibacillus TaxID=44249 RepID=UPI000BA0564B|nr:ABC transporter permease [Paenibacillus sp. VTT E-133280]OZQ69075.1 ribose ABC transporter permease [Paenibacillus sp. VTT E-133280]